MARVRITAECPCGAETPLRELGPTGVPLRAGVRTDLEYIVRCVACGELIRVTNDDLTDAQHELLVALGEA